MGITAPAATRQAGERNMRGRKRQSTGIDRQLDRVNGDNSDTSHLIRSMAFFQAP
jgi:hypothetical protein